MSALESDLDDNGVVAFQGYPALRPVHHTQEETQAVSTLGNGMKVAPLACGGTVCLPISVPFRVQAAASPASHHTPPLIPLLGNPSAESCGVSWGTPGWCPRPHWSFATWVTSLHHSLGSGLGPRSSQTLAVSHVPARAAHLSLRGRHTLDELRRWMSTA